MTEEEYILSRWNNMSEHNRKILGLDKNRDEIAMLWSKQYWRLRCERLEFHMAITVPGIAPGIMRAVERDVEQGYE